MIEFSHFTDFSSPPLNMKQHDGLENGTRMHGNPSVDVVQSRHSGVSGETMDRILDLELWDLDSQISSVSGSLPNASLLPVTFSRSTRWGATQSG